MQSILLGWHRCGQLSALSIMPLAERLIGLTRVGFAQRLRRAFGDTNVFCLSGLSKSI